MITFKQFLTEDKAYIDLSDLKRDCSKFLSETTSPLYRGYDPEMNWIVSYDHPVDRKSKDSSDIWNTIFNYCADKILGIKNIRAKTLFGTGSILQTSIYGPAQMVFLKGDFKCVSSPVTHDTFNDVNFEQDLDVRFENILKFSDDDYPYLEEQQIYEILHKASKECPDISDEMGFTNAMINAFEDAKRRYHKRRINMDAVESKISKVYKSFLSNSIELFKISGLRIMPIQKAIDTRNEIAIYESGGYYMVSLNAIHRLVKEGKIQTKTTRGEKALKIVDDLLEKNYRISSAFQGKIFYENFKILISEA